MGKGKGAGENSKKAAGNAKKAEVASRKQEAENAKLAAAEDAEWSEGAKSKNAKKEAEEAKKEEARRRKAEREAEMEAESASIKPKKAAGGAKKAGAKKSSGLDAALKDSDLQAHNIDDAISALEITTGKNNVKVERHPERRFKPALAAFEERRLPEMREEHPGLRLNQYKQRIFEEFKKSPENPFNQATVSYDATSADVAAKREDLRKSKEAKLAH